MTFRVRTRPGLWVSALLLLALLANQHNSHLMMIILTFNMTLISFLSAPTDENALVMTNRHSLMVSSGLLMLMCLAGQVGFLASIVSMMALSAFHQLLPSMFSTFKYSFSYGEGCLVLQSVIGFAAMSLIDNITDKQDPSTVAGSYNIIANVGLTYLLALCALSYIPHLGLVLNSSTRFYLIGM